jgi:hypothetical protein
LRVTVVSTQPKVHGLSGTQLRDFRHRGPTLDQFLKAQGFSRDSILAFRRVVAWWLCEDMAGTGITTEELARRVRTRPHDLGHFLADPVSAPLLLNTLREAMAAVGTPLITFWDILQ